MSRNVCKTCSDSRLIDAFELMRDHRVHHVAVVDGDRLLGMISDCQIHDAMPRGRLDDAWAPLASPALSSSIATVMSMMPVTIAPGASIREAAEIMCREKLSALPVVDGQKLVGLLSAEDVLWAIAEGFAVESS